MAPAKNCRACRRSDDVTIVFHEKNCGKGAAIRTALAYTRGEYVLIQDSDLEYDPQDYPALLRPLEAGSCNVVYGVRPDRPERGLRFFLGAKLLTHLTNFLYRAGIHDEATCYKVVRRSLLSQITSAMSSLRVLPGSDREALPHRREDRRSSHLVPSTLGGGREKDPPLRRMAGHLDPDPLPLHPAQSLVASRPRNSASPVRRKLLSTPIRLTISRSRAWNIFRRMSRVLIPAPSNSAHRLLVQSHKEYSSFWGIRFGGEFLRTFVVVIKDTNADPPVSRRTRKAQYFRRLIAAFEMVGELCGGGLVGESADLYCPFSR